jgi:chloramphenicol-sensitive protein RarD
VHSPDADLRRGAIAGLSAYVLWGLLTIYWHELHGLSSLGLIGQRIAWSSMLLVVAITATRRWPVLRGALANPSVRRRVVCAALLLSANWTSYVWAVTHNNVVETALGYFIAPLGTVAIGVVLFHERLRRLQAIALGIAAVAVVVLTGEAGRVPLIALILGGTWGLYGLIKRTVPLTPIESLAAETFVLFPVALAVVAIVESGEHAVTMSADGAQLALVFGTGLITVIPLLLFAFAAPRVPFTLLGPMQYAVPTINFVLAVWLYDEPMPRWRVVGFGFVWVALAVFTFDLVRATRTQRANAIGGIVDASRTS